MHLSWAAQKRLAQELTEFRLTVPQYVALRAIQHAQNGYTMSKLAEASHQVAATMTGIIDRLVEQGLVERRRDPADRRALHILLTPQGIALLEQVEGRQHERMGRFIAAMSIQERQHMLAWMQRYLELALDEEH